MRIITFFSVLFVVFGSSFGPKITDKQAFYKVLAAGSEENIEKEISRLSEEKKTSFTNAYLGSLYMKKAGFLKGAANKVKTFKKGAQMLEKEINDNPAIVEYRFLRLTIQENAPKILKYNKELSADKKIIEDGYERLEPDLKKVIKDYATGSKVINVGDLK